MDSRAVRVQDLHNLSGKLLRIDPVTGQGAPDNPYFQPGDPNSNQSKVFYYGVRNAYRFSFDPVTNLPWSEMWVGTPGRRSIPARRGPTSVPTSKAQVGPA